MPILFYIFEYYTFLYQNNAIAIPMILATLIFIINENAIKEGSLDELRQIADEKLVKADD